MQFVVASDDLRKQGVYFDPSSHNQGRDLNQDSAHPRPSSPTHNRPRTGQACDKCRERKTKARPHICAPWYLSHSLVVVLWRKANMCSLH